jgi:hypothetical protein
MGRPLGSGTSGISAGLNCSGNSRATAIASCESRTWTVAKYREISRFLGYTAKVEGSEFEALRRGKPHAFWPKRNVDE